MAPQLAVLTLHPPDPHVEDPFHVDLVESLDNLPFSILPTSGESSAKPRKLASYSVVLMWADRGLLGLMHLFVSCGGVKGPLGLTHPCASV